MKITVLGRYGPYPAPGGNCSGYLLEGSETRVMLDCGNGTFSALQKIIDFCELDAIILSHLHMDHMADCFISRYAMETAIALEKRNEPLRIYAPEDSQMYPLLEYRNAVELLPLDSCSKLFLKEFEFGFLPTVHSKPCFAVKVSHGESTLVYSADTEYFDGLIDFAEGCDLFLCEANYISEDLFLGRKNHLASFQSALIARKAGVKRLILTHLHPKNSLAVTLAEAEKEFPAAELAEEGMAITI